MSETTELKPCPFCGGEGDLYNANVRKPDHDGTKQCNWVVDCSVCNFGNEFENSSEAAAKAWNTRPTEDALREENANLLSANRNTKDWYDDLKCEYDKLKEENARLREENKKISQLLFERSRVLIWEGQPPEPVGEVCNICEAFGETHKEDCIFFDETALKDTEG